MKKIDKIHSLFESKGDVMKNIDQIARQLEKEGLDIAIFGREIRMSGAKFIGFVAIIAKEKITDEIFNMAANLWSPYSDFQTALIIAKNGGLGATWWITNGEDACSSYEDLITFLSERPEPEWGRLFD